MDIEVKVQDKNPDVKVVLLKGNLDVVAAETALPAIMDALDQSAAGLILDLAGMGFMSSAGLRVLISVRRKSETDGKQIAMIGAHPAIYKIFKIAGLDTTFRFFESEAEAIRAIWPQARNTL